MAGNDLIINKPVLEQIRSEQKESVTLNIKRFFTDSSGSIITGGAIPVSMQKPFPFYLFGEFDSKSGFAIADRVMSKKFNTNLFGIYVWGVNTPLFFPNVVANINNEFQKGDLLQVFVDDMTNPQFYCFMVVNCENGPYASFFGQLNTTQLDKERWGTFKIYDIQYSSWTSKRQIILPIFTISTQWDTDFLSNPINPSTYYVPQYKPGVNELIIPIHAVANQFFGLAHFMAFENDLLILTFNIYV